MSSNRSFLRLCFASAVTLGVQPLFIKAAAPSPEDAPDSFIFSAQGGYYDSHRVKIPSQATGVRVKITIVESYENDKWGAATALGFSRRDVKDPDETELLAKLSFNEKKQVHQIRLRTPANREDMPVKASLTPGATVIWEADWTADHYVLRINGEVIGKGKRGFTPEMLRLSVSSIKVRVDEISFHTQTP